MLSTGGAYIFIGYYRADDGLCGESLGIMSLMLTQQEFWALWRPTGNHEVYRGGHTSHLLELRKSRNVGVNLNNIPICTKSRQPSHSDQTAMCYKICEEVISRSPEVNLHTQSTNERRDGRRTGSGWGWLVGDG